MGIVSHWECLMPSHKTNRLERAGDVQWQKVDWKGGMGVLRVLDVLGVLCVQSRHGSARLLGLGSSFGKNTPINAGKGINVPSGHSWGQDQ